MKSIHNILTNMHVPYKFVLPSVLIMTFFQIPLVPVVQFLEEKKGSVEDAFALNTLPEVYASEVTILDDFFGNEIAPKMRSSIVEQQMEFVSTRKAYPASLGVIDKHEETIKTLAREKRVPEDVAIGVSLLENGGSEFAVSKAGALGVFQLMPGTARSLGLTVNKKVDERKIPKKNIEAGVTYLRQNYERFGDWGLATWAYHAGEGNVSKAIAIYAKANHRVTLKGVKDPEPMRRYVEQHGITVHKLLSDQSVKAFTRKLNDDSAGYPYKVLATATLFKKAKYTKISVGPMTKANLD